MFSQNNPVAMRGVDKMRVDGHDAGGHDERESAGRQSLRRASEHTWRHARSNRRSAVPAHRRQHIAQYGGLIVLFVFRAVDECERPFPFPGCAKQFAHPGNLRRRRELVAIAILKRLPPLRIVPEPLTKLSARREIFRPPREREARPASSARPYTIHEHAITVIGRRFIVCALDRNLHHRAAVDARKAARCGVAAPKSAPARTTGCA